MYKYVLKIDRFDKITGCYDCPLCYDDLYCTAKSDNTPVIHPKDYRPDNCPLKEVNEE